MDCSLPGSSFHGILHARVLEWVAFPSPGHLPDPGIETGSPALQADPFSSEPPGKAFPLLPLLLFYYHFTTLLLLLVSLPCHPIYEFYE